MRTEGIELRPTEDYDAMVRLGKEAGLEMEQLGPVLSAYGFYELGEMVACVCLKEHEGTYLLECLAVAESRRGLGLGRRLVREVENDARSRGATKILVLARKPGFFIKIGYRVTEPGEVDYPSVSGCASCPQFRNTCSPAVVMRYL